VIKGKVRISKINVFFIILGIILIRVGIYFFDDTNLNNSVSEKFKAQGIETSATVFNTAISLQLS